MKNKDIKKMNLIKSSKVWIGLIFLFFVLTNMALSEDWHKYPSLGIMTSFIKAPYEKEPSIPEWARDLGNQFNADEWINQFRQAGAEYVIFYAKWVDGFCLYDTTTTDFKSKQDYLREISEACEKSHFPLVVYFNAFCDNNPDFEEWALKDGKADYIVLSSAFPHKMHTHYSPFGKIIETQTREILSNYPAVQGLWFDVPYHRTHTDNPYVQDAFQRMYGKRLQVKKPFEGPAPEANPGDLERIEPNASGSEDEFKEFEGRSVAMYLEKVRDMAARYRPGCKLTTNASALAAVQWNFWGRNAAPELDYLNYEGHHYHQIKKGVLMARSLPWPVEIGVKINASWYVPYQKPAPAPMFSFKKSLALAAVCFFNGANVWLCVTPGYDGTFGADMDIASRIGNWYTAAKPYFSQSKPWGNIGVAYGNLPCRGEVMPSQDSLWQRKTGYQKSPWDEVETIMSDLHDAGHFGQVLAQWPVIQEKSRILYKGWPENLNDFDVLIVPERTFLSTALVKELQDYAQGGGRIILFGHAGLLDEFGRKMPLDRFSDLLGLERLESAILSDDDDGLLTIQSDSVYHDPYAADNILKSQGFWSSSSSPMPHWVEIPLEQQTRIQRIEIVNRSGPYRIKDFDIDIYQDDAWRGAYSGRNTNDKTIHVNFQDVPSASKVRIIVRHETLNDQDRQIADIQEVKIYDSDGINVLERDAAKYLQGTKPVKETAKFGFEQIQIRPLMMQVTPRTAGALKLADNNQPLVFENDYGRGKVYYVAASEASFGEKPMAWKQLIESVGRPPVFLTDPGGRYRLVVNRYRSGFILHVTDEKVFDEDFDYKTQACRISIDHKALGCGNNVSLLDFDRIPNKLNLSVDQNGTYIEIDITPDPIVSLFLE